jgi:hypothetical protein
MEKDKDKKKSQEQQEQQTESLKEVAKRLNEAHERDRKMVKHSVKEMDVLKSIAAVLMDIRHQLAIDALNRKRQLKKADKKDDGGRSGAAEIAVLKEDRLGKLMKIMVGIVASISGLIVGLIAGFGMFLKDMGFIAKKVKNLAKSSERLKKIIVPIEKFFQRIRVNLKLFARNLSRIAKGESKFAKVFQSIQKGFASIGKFLTNFAKTAQNSGKTIGKIARYLGNFGKAFGKIFSIFKTIGKVVGRLFVPITALMLIFDGLKESFSVFTDESKSMSEKIVSLIFVIPKVIGKFFTDFIDSIKAGISWLLKKVFGEDNVVSKFLDKFNFTEIWTKFIDGMVEWITHFPTKFKELTKSIGEWWDNFSFADTVKAITGFFSDMWKKIKGWFTFSKKESDLDESEEDTNSAFTDIFTNALTSIKKFFTDIGSSIITTITGAFNSVIGFFTGDDSIGETISKWWTKFKEDPIGGVMAIAMTPINMIKGAFNSILSFFTGEGSDTGVGETISQWWTGFKEDPLGGVKAIVQAPINMLKAAVSSILSFFTKDKAEENVESDEDSGSIFTDVMDGVKSAIRRVFDSVIEFFTNTFSFTAIKDNMPDIGGFLKDAGNWIGNVIKDVITFIKNKAMFWKKSDEEKEEEAAKKAAEEDEKLRKALASESKKERKNAADKAGIVDEAYYNTKERTTVDAEKLKDLSNEELSQFAADWKGYTQVQAAVEAEMDRRAKNPGNMQTAIAPAPATPTSEAEAFDFASSPMPVQIVGTGQEMGQAGDDLVLNQQLMEENKALKESQGGNSTAIMAPSINTSNNTSVSNISTSMPSTRDYSDYTQAYRPMGNSR